MEFVSNFCFFPIISLGDNDVAAVDFTLSSIHFEKPGRKVVFTFKPLCCRRRSTSTSVGEGQFFFRKNSLAKESNVSSTHLAIILKPNKDVCGGSFLDTLRQSPLQHIATTMERPFCDGISSDIIGSVNEAT